MTNQQEQIKIIAEESVGVFEQISQRADEEIKNYPGDPANSFAAGNTFTSSAASNLLKIQDKNKQSYLGLMIEPAIARIEVEDDAGVKKMYYISRHGSISLGSNVLLADYNTPIGRLASLPVGEERSIEINGQKITVYKLANILYKPIRLKDGWDSNPSVLTDDEIGKFTIESLRKLLDSPLRDESDELETLLSEVYVGINAGLSHQTRTAMALRDQPILDEFQDEIFRLPIDNQIIILGPPGTGKTTTLIKRLGQKINKEYLDEREKKYAIDTRGAFHSTNWLMFTPSELLKHYVKEAFNRELVPASDDNIKTWLTFRNDLARNTLNILKTPTGGRFYLSSKGEYLSAEITRDARRWFDEFSKFHTKRIVKQLVDGLDIITSSCSADKMELIESIKNTVGHSDYNKLMTIYSGLNSIENVVLPVLNGSKANSDELIKKERNLIFNINKKVFNDLAEYLASLEEDEDDGEDEDGIFDENIEQGGQEPVKQTEIQKSVNSYTNAIRSLARYKFRKRGVPKNSKAAKIRDWLGDRIPSDETLVAIGQEITFQNGLRRYVNPTRRYITQVPNSFIAYRKTLLEKNEIYIAKPSNNYQIDSVELDSLILLMLRTTRELVGQSFISRNKDDQRFNTIAIITDKFKTQILVDEATDFSVLQLACMESLTSIDSRSFFACGDFNQRITGNGVRTDDQINWISQSIETKRINTVYRQSRKLNNFAKDLLIALDGDMTSLGMLPEDSTHEGAKPVLFEKCNNLNDKTAWLASRIAEIEIIVKQMPTIAILVKSEDDVKPVAEALNIQLEQNNLRAIACLEGQSLGQDTDVRVFDVQHIKGLEFEAVFFLDVDELSETLPDLFDRYLYVGATRAATYLGLTCTTVLPSLLADLRHHFTETWS